MKIDNNKFDAIILIGKAKEYFLLIIGFFNELNKQRVKNLLTDTQGNDPLLYIILLRAAMLSRHWSWNEILQNMAEIQFEEKSCHALIDSEKLTGSQIISLLRERIQAVGLVSISPMIYAAIETNILTGPEILELLKIYSSPQLIELATPQLEKYINEEPGDLRQELGEESSKNEALAKSLEQIAHELRTI